MEKSIFLLLHKSACDANDGVINEQADFAHKLSISAGNDL